MHDESERAALNHLIETCRDAERGFRHIAEHTADSAVKTVLLDIASQHARFAAALLPPAQRLGGASTSDGTTAGALHRTWVDLRSALIRSDPNDAVHDAEWSEHVSLGAYEHALHGMLPPTTRDLVEAQYAELQKTAARLRDLEG